MLVLVGLAVGAAVVSSLLRDDEPAARAAPAQRIVAVPQLGLSFAHPRSWSSSVAGRVVRLRSPEGSAIMTFSSPVEGSEPRRVKQALRETLTDRLKPATVLADGPGKLGPRTVTTLELAGFSATKRVRAIAIVEDTRWRTYAITLLTPDHPSRRRLVEVKQILDSVRLSKPSQLDD